MAYESMTLCLSHSPGFARDSEERFGTRFRAGLAVAAAAARAFAPTLVVFFGSDHRRAFTDTVPAISVMLGAEGRGDLLSPTGPYDVPTTLAADLARWLLDHNLDVAVTRRVALDHGFGQTAGSILGGLDTVPMIPVFINCATPPLLPPRRAAELGTRTGEFIRNHAASAGLDQRVLYLGSGGLSHDPPTLALTPEALPEDERKKVSAAHRDAARDKIRPDWDQRFLADLGKADASWAYQVGQADIDPAGVGANEVRTWIAAYTAGGSPLAPVSYEPVPEWLTGMGIAMSGAESGRR